MYFAKFPTTHYTFDGKSATLITDFMRRVNIASDVRNNAAIYQPYTITDGETPEVVAYKVYGDTFLHWIILLTNEIVDPRYDWCLNQSQLFAFTQAKYDDPYGVHHYEDADGYIVDGNFPGAGPVNNYQFEERENEKKRVIKILDPVFVSEFIKQFEAEIAS